MTKALLSSDERLEREREAEGFYPPLYGHPGQAMLRPDDNRY